MLKSNMVEFLQDVGKLDVFMFIWVCCAVWLACDIIDNIKIK